MANYYLDFVGLNTFIYEPVGYDLELDSERITYLNGVATSLMTLNHLGVFQNGTDSLPNTLEGFKNHSFSHNLPTTASFFTALMLRRNGPYGFPMWKQTRISENPLSRKQRKENVFTFVREPGAEVSMNNDGRLSSLRGKYGAIKSFDEVAVTSRYKPFSVGGATVLPNGDLERFELQAAYGNETNYFNNNEVNNYYNKKDKRSPQYKTVAGFYLNGGLQKDSSPIDVFEYFKYKECIYPPRIYQYKSYVRQRTTFSFPWRDDRDDRTESAFSNGFGSEETHGGEIASGHADFSVFQSIWPLDVPQNWISNVTRFSASHTPFGSWENHYGFNQHGSTYTASRYDYGILQNSYCLGSDELPDKIIYPDGLETVVGIAPLYNYKHTLSPSSSVASPNGMTIEGINSGSALGNLDHSRDLPSGEAMWEAGSQSGLNPFYDSYDKFIDGVRQKGKDYSIVPEFRISEHVPIYQTKGPSEEILDIFSLTGSLNGTTDSSDSKFYKIYSTTEFMKHFEVVKKDHKDFVEPMSITLKCKAIKKFLPYEGFYPAQRSVDLAKQFYNSYKDFVSPSGSVYYFGAPNTSSAVLFQNLMVPVFAPGIFFNTIKSGVAVDYPLIDSNMFLSNSSDYGNVFEDSSNYYIKNSNNPAQTTGQFFDRRLPFETIIEPEKHLAGTRVFCNDPHLFANNSGSVFWNGGGNNLYKLMAHNFLAETNSFFMKNNRYTTIASRPSSDPTVGFAEQNTRYSMRVKMYKSADVPSTPLVSGSSGVYKSPQYSSDMKETFTMYSRPSAFGPPQMITASFFSTASQIKLGDTGENYAFTPPYYYGESWADISFVSSEPRKYSIEEIIASSSVYYYRFANDTDVENTLKTRSINGMGDDFTDTNSESQIAMNLDASVNLFSQQINVENSVDPNNPTTRWIIQTKFETPMLNFNHLSESNSITLPDSGSQSVPRGMWHQYGRIEQDNTKGIFLQVDSVPNDWVENYMSESANHKSLADLCGFSTEAARLGELANSKTVFEAIVAVPFVEQEGERFFFRIARDDLARSFSTSRQEQNRVGDSVFENINRLRKYVLPPPLDFINNPEIDPFAMYVFEFKHKFSKQDLADMWQNLYPKIGQTFQTAESTISHQLLAHELLGGGAILDQDGELDTNAIGNEIPDRVRWMVFKVKQRAKINYYEKIYGREDRLSEAVVSSQGQNVEVSYNWPYDFFSLVELAKIETEVKFAQRVQNPRRKPVNESAPIARTDLPELTKGGKSELFEDAIAGNLPTPDDSPQPSQDGSDYVDPTLQGGLGRATDAWITDAFLQGQMEMNRFSPNQGGVNNPYGNTPLGDFYWRIQSGMGPAGNVGIPINQGQYGVSSQNAGSAPNLVEIEGGEAIQEFASNSSLVSTALFRMNFGGYNQ